MTDIISWLAVIVILIATTTLLIHKDWRISLGALAVLYLAMFWHITSHLPFAMGSAKLITGWMVIAILGMTRLNLSNSEEEKKSFYPQGQTFRLALMAIIALASFAAAPRIEAAIPGLGVPVITSGLILIGGGIIQLGISTNLLRISLGLLTFIAGFEILYAAIESAILVAGLLAIINIGLSLLGSYLLIAGSPTQETQDEV